MSLVPGGIILPARPHPDRHGLPVAAGVLFVDPDDRVLLVEPIYQSHWDLPGGMVEAGESPWAAAKREVREELGLDIRPGRLLVVDYLPPRPLDSEGLRLVYDGRRLPADVDVRLDPSELRSWAWCTSAEVVERTERHAPLLCRRILAARLAQSTGVSAYRESGRRP